jgi:ABC-type tungstate transport system permease subunit
MARYIDADELLAHLKKLADEYLYAESNKDKYDIVYGALTGVRQAITYTKTEPAADVAEVVRCIDCEFCKFNSSAEIYKCDRRGYFTETVTPTDYCSWGKKKGE